MKLFTKYLRLFPIRTKVGVLEIQQAVTTGFKVNNVMSSVVSIWVTIITKLNKATDSNYTKSSWF